MSSIILDFPNKTTTISLDRNDPFPTSYGDADFDVARSPLMYTSNKSYEALSDFKDALEKGKPITSQMINACIESISNNHFSSKHVLYRTDTAAELGIHGRNYTTDLRQLNYRTMIDNQREVIRSLVLI